MQVFFTFLIKVVLMSLTLTTYQKNAFAVNILSWWGYFNSVIVSELEQRCGAKISYDEFYSIDEFLKRFHEQEYSIVIFPQSTYNLVAQKVANKGTDISDIRKKYAEGVSNSGFAKNLPKNVGIFAIEAAGFLYNSEKLTIGPELPLEVIFQKLKNKKIIILDNPIEPMKLIAKLGEQVTFEEAVLRFKKIFTNVDVILSNDIANFYKDENIVILHAWIGNSYEIIKKNPKYKFMHHPKVSYIGGDLIASLDKNPKTSCVMKILADKEMNTKIIAHDFRMSPYGSLREFEKKIDPLYLQVNNSFFDKTYDKLQWHGRPSSNEFQKISELWQKIKVEIQN